MQIQNENFSKIVLLILVGVAIYFLLYSSDTFLNTKNKENFDSSVEYTQSLPAIPVMPTQSLSAPIDNLSIDNNIISNSSMPPVINYSDNSNYGNVIDYSSNSAPSIESQVGSAIDYSSLAAQSFDSQYAPSSSSASGSAIDYSSMVAPSFDSQPAPNTNLNNFTPSDNSMYDNYGTSLDDAFSPPVPPGTNTDAIDFNKSNTDNYNAKDFLPKEINDQWFETDFSLAKYQLNDDKLINTDRYIIGINTVGTSLKNASYDLRGSIPNPKFVVGPFNNSTIEPDFNLKPLC
jgi:hypothetical protein